MADTTARADLDRQITELVAVLESQLVAGLDPYLAEALLSAIAAVRLRGDAVLAGRVMVTVGATYETIRDLVERFDSRLVAVHEDVASWRAEQEIESSIVARAMLKQEASFLEHSARLVRLEAQMLEALGARRNAPVEHRARLADTSALPS